MFANEYYQWWYVFVDFLFVLLFVAGLVLMTIFMCKDSEGTRGNLRLAGYLMLASIILIMIWNMVYIMHFRKKD